MGTHRVVAQIPPVVQQGYPGNPLLERGIRATNTARGAHQNVKTQCNNRQKACSPRDRRANSRDSCWLTTSYAVRFASARFWATDPGRRRGFLQLPRYYRKGGAPSRELESVTSVLGWKVSMRRRVYVRDPDGIRVQLSNVNYKR